MPVPYTFGTATTSIPLSNLDANFNTPVTIGNTTVGLGNTVTTIGNLTLTNATISTGNVTVTTGIFGAGSNTAPSITTTGDTNTGIFFPAADTIAFTEGGVESMRIDSSGNVGIGTNSPSYPLNIVRNANGAQKVFFSNNSSGSSAETAFSVSNGTAEGSLRVAGGSYGGYGAYTANNTLIYNDTSAITIMADNASNGIIKFATGSSSERMRITSGGNVGIATSSPASALEIYRAVSTTGSLTDASLMLSTTATTGRKVSIGFGLGGGVANTCAANIGYDVTNGAGAGLGDIYFSTRSVTSDTAPTERMRITSGGSVLVGTTTDPAYSGHTTLVLNSATNGGVLDIQVAGSRIGSFQASGSTELRMYANTSVISTFYANASERMRITSGGDFCVGGTTSVVSSKQTIHFFTGSNGLAISTTDNIASTDFATFRANSATCGVISRVGTTSAVVYTTTSDYRLKTVIAPVSDAGTRIDALEPIEYDWNTGGRTKGFLAHKFAEVYPNSVTGEKDAVDKEGKPVYQSMQASSAEVMADLIAEIQSLRKRVAQLESK